MPDLFSNDPAPLDAFSGTSDFDIGRWFQTHGPETVQPVVEKVKSSLLGELGVKKLGAVGYCFGGKYVVEGLAEGGYVDAGFIAHPSAIERDELRAIKKPLSIAAAGKTPSM
jgi:dienelactone hydrolase